MKRKRLNRKERYKVWEKSNGHCWYCGAHIASSSNWHVDHVDPVYQQEFGKCPDESNAFGNLVPACSSCNLFKAAFSVEEFRKELEEQVNRARRYSINFRAAERHGLIKVLIKPVVFWFEQASITQ